MGKNTKRSEIAQRLVDLRNKHKDFKTQKDVADALEVKRDTYARYETDTDLPLPIIKKICELYRITSDYLIFGENSYTYSVNEKPRIYQPAFSTKIDYNTNIDSDELILTEEEIKLIKGFRELPDSKKKGILLTVCDDDL